jgi:hypothetical protein
LLGRTCNGAPNPASIARLPVLIVALQLMTSLVVAPACSDRQCPGVAALLAGAVVCRLPHILPGAPRNERTPGRLLGSGMMTKFVWTVALMALVFAWVRSRRRWDFSWRSC